MKRFLLAILAVITVCILAQWATPQIRQSTGRRLVSVGLQDISQSAQGTKGTVWFVATDGAATNDGLSARTAKLSPKTVIEAAAARDTVILGPGVFALGDNAIAVPADVAVIGAGIDRTRVTSIAESPTHGCIVNPGNRSFISELTIEGTLTDGSYQFPLGAHEARGDNAFSDAVLRNVRLIGDTDGLYFNHTSPCTCTAFNLVIDCAWDAIRSQGADHEVLLVDPIIRTVGPNGVANGIGNGIYLMQGNLIVVNPTIHVTGNGTTQRGAYAFGASAILTLIDPKIYVSAATSQISIGQATNAVVTVAGGDYDRSKTSGTITEISPSLEKNDYAYQCASDIFGAASNSILLLGWITPSTTEQDLSPHDHDATYSGFLPSDQIRKGMLWGLNFYAGSNEYLTISDDADFTFDDEAGANGFTVGGWVQIVATTAIQTLISKWDETSETEVREWEVYVDAAEKVGAAIYDESANVQCSRLTNAAVAADWHFIVVVYNGAGGATAANGVTIYVDGIAVASTATNDGSYVGMEDLARDVWVGATESTVGAAQEFFQGDMGPIFMSTDQLTADQVCDLYLTTKGKYGL